MKIYRVVFTSIDIDESNHTARKNIKSIEKVAYL